MFSVTSLFSKSFNSLLSGAPSAHRWATITPSSLFDRLKALANARYMHNFPAQIWDLDCLSNLKLKLCLLRDMSTVLGVKIFAKEYALMETGEVDPSLLFQERDIVELIPRVKTVEIVNKDSRNYIASGKSQQHINPGLASELISQGMNIQFQVHGPLNTETAACMSRLAQLSFKFGDFGPALSYQARSCLVYRKTLGELHPQVAYGYSTLAMYHHAMGNFERAFKFMYRALFILELSAGTDHPDIAALYLNMAHMYNEINQEQAAMDTYKKALYRYVTLFGENHI